MNPSQVNKGSKSSQVIQRSQVKSSQVKSSQVKSSQVKSSQVKSSQVKSSQVKSSQVKSSQVKSSQVKSSQVKSSQVKSSHSEIPSQIKSIFNILNIDCRHFYRANQLEWCTQNSNIILKYLLSQGPKTVDKYLSKIPISEITIFYYYVVTYKLRILHY